jgi:hypothetical protein
MTQSKEQVAAKARQRANTKQTKQQTKHNEKQNKKHKNKAKKASWILYPFPFAVSLSGGVVLNPKT